MSDDVRARAEAVALAYKNLRESISRWHGDGFAVSVNLGPLYESCDSLTAALAVAPATAQPVAWEIIDKDGVKMLDHPFRSREAAEAVMRECETWRWPARAPFTLSSLYAAPPATGDAAAVRAIRDYAVESAATCRRAESERAADIANRAENHAILPMLREQHYSWGEKAKSYDALVAFIDAIPLPATANRDIERSST